MLRVDVEKVFIEHCISCKTHHWCTNHDEEKYKEYFSRCQAAISRVCFNVTVVENTVPDGFTDQFITDPTISKPGKFHFPRIGSFEVYFRGVCIFSKINSMKWPRAEKIAEKVKKIQTSPQVESKKKSKPKRVKSAFPGKKRKVRKSNKKKNGIKKVEYGDRDRDALENLVAGKKKVDNGKNYAELFRDPHSRSSSSDRKNSDSEQPVPPYEYYKAQPKAKTPPRYLDSFGQSKNTNQKQPSPPKTQAPQSEIQNAVRQVKKVEKYSSSSSSSNFAHKSESQESSSESYRTNPSIEKIDLAGLLKRTQEEPKIEKNSSSSAEYHSSDYEKYQDSSSSSQKHSEPPIVKKSNSDSEDYKEDYEKSSSSSSSSKAKKYQKKSSSSSSKSKKSKKKHSSSESSTSKHLKRSEKDEYESEKYESDKEEYDQDFEDQAETHPLRKVDKSYPVNLPLGEETRKKITYENLSNEDTEFSIKTSHPDYMSIKEEYLMIRKNAKEKIQLRFAPIFTESERKFYIYIDKNSAPWECIEIVAEYQ